MRFISLFAGFSKAKAKARVGDDGSDRGALAVGDGKEMPQISDRERLGQYL